MPCVTFLREATGKSRSEASNGRDTDHFSVRKLRAVDLVLRTVKLNTPHFPGTSLQRDRWDHY